MSPKPNFALVSLRPTSSAASFPWFDRRVTLVRIGRNGSVVQAKTESEKRSLLADSDERDLVLAAWPGEWSQDVFVVDDLGAARIAVGLSRHKAAPKQSDDLREPRASSEDRSAPGRVGDVWSHLAELPGLPEAGQREVVDHAAGQWSAKLALRLLERPDLEVRSRERLFAEAPRGQARELVASEHTTAAEALALSTRFLECADVVEAALLRPDTRAEIERALSRLSYREAAKLWLEGQRWSGTKSPHLAELILQVVLAAEPVDLPTQGYGAERYEKPAMIRSLAGVLAPPKRLELLNDPRHGRAVQQALLASEELSDTELVACLPEIMGSATAVGADAVPVIAEYVQRFPRLLQVATDQVRQAFGRLLAEGWSPTQAARAGQWDALVTVAELADAPELVEALAHAAVFDMPPSAQHAQRWREPRRYQLVDLLVVNSKASDKQIRYILERLPADHLEEIRQGARSRSRLRRICTEINEERTAGIHPASAWSEPPPPELPTDETLSAVANPEAALRELLKYRGRDRDRVLDHVLRSAYMTDEQAWRLPVQDLQGHPRYGPLLAAKIKEICGDSAERWHVVSESLGRSNQLLVTTLVSRVEAV
ncbi:hypothetical protein [Amycolatopsis sp. MEPSY49]|uniref:hypothetical protein n=1 Tax=Amycolatopsis sp. MEPSY49 TaxID=3151600 RepID=UPI003EF97A13